MRPEARSPADPSEQAAVPGLSRQGLVFLNNLVALSGGEIVSKAIGFLAFAYLARALGASAYGVLEVAVSLSVFFAMVTDFGLCPIGAREVARDPSLTRSLAARIPVARLCLAAGGIAAMALIGLRMQGLGDQPLLVWLFSLSLIPVALNQRWVFQGLEKMGVVALAQVIRMSVFALGAVLLIRGPEDIVVAGWAELAATSLAAAFLFVAQAVNVGPPALSVRLSAIKPLLSESVPLGLSHVIWSLGQYLPIMLIAGFKGPVEAAWFGAAHRIAFSLGTFSSVYHFNLLPALTRSLDTSTSELQAMMRRSIRVTAWGGVLSAVGLTVLAIPLCQLVFGAEFATAAVPLAVLAWAFPVALTSGHARSALVAAGRQHRLLAAQTAGTVATAVLGIALIPRWGALGGAITVLASGCVVWGVARFFATREVAPLGDLGPVLRAVAVAAAVLIALRELDVSFWWGAPIAGLAMLLGAPLIDRSLWYDVRTTLQALRGSPGIGQDADISDAQD